MSDTKVLIPSVALSITRDAMTILPAIVPAHEVRILQVLHGTEHVARADEQPNEKHEIEPEDEVERLSMKYGQGVLEKAFGTAFDLEIDKAVEAAAATTAKGKKAAAADA
jgi:hypothetical protein